MIYEFKDELKKEKEEKKRRHFCISQIPILNCKIPETTLRVTNPAARKLYTL